MRLKLDGQGQVYRSPTELWAATTSRRCPSGYSYPRHSGSLPSVGESFGARDWISPGGWSVPGPSGGCPMTPGSLDFSDRIRSSQLGVRRWIHGFRCPWPVLFRVMWWFTKKEGQRQSDCTPGNHVLTDCTTITNCSGRSTGGGEGASGCRSKTASDHAGGGECRRESVIGGRAGDGVFLMWTPETWGEQMFLSGHFFSVLATGVVGRGTRWPISGSMAWGSSSMVWGGMVRAGGSASRTIGD